VKRVGAKRHASCCHLLHLTLLLLILALVRHIAGNLHLLVSLEHKFWPTLRCCLILRVLRLVVFKYSFKIYRVNLDGHFLLWVLLKVNHRLLLFGVNDSSWNFLHSSPLV
jgi:hypothetical protein